MQWTFNSITSVERYIVYNSTEEFNYQRTHTERERENTFLNTYICLIQDDGIMNSSCQSTRNDEHGWFPVSKENKNFESQNCSLENNFQARMIGLSFFAFLVSYQKIDRFRWLKPTHKRLFVCQKPPEFIKIIRIWNTYRFSREGPHCAQYSVLEKKTTWKCQITCTDFSSLVQSGRSIRTKYAVRDLNVIKISLFFPFFE